MIIWDSGEAPKQPKSIAPHAGPKSAGESVPLLLSTCRGTPIPNERILELLPPELPQLELLKAKWTRNSTHFRCESSPYYNCHGMVFASRRTGIYDPEAVRRILAEDGYARIAEESACSGDTAIYHDPEGVPEHSAAIVAPWKPGALGMILVVSKWGRGPEVVHPLRECPYSPGNIQFYRQRTP